MTRNRPDIIEVYNSVGGAAFFEGLIVGWENAGWRVCREHAITEMDYRAARGVVGRWRLRWRMYGLYALKSWWVARRGRGRVPLRVVTTNPFFLPVLVQRAAAGSGTTINLLYDLYPDALVRAGAVRKGSWLERRLAAVTRMALQECDATVFLGRHLKQHAEARYGVVMRSAIIAVGADGAPFRNKPPQPVDASRDINVLYAGQMGSMHDIETLRKLLLGGVPPGVTFSFQASGAGYVQLRREFERAERTKWGGALPEADWRQAMEAAHVALVTIVRGGEEVVMPSKTFSALVAGQAIMAICAPVSDLAELVRNHGCGWTVEPGDVAGLRCVLREIAVDRAGLLEKRRRAFDVGHRLFDSRVIARQWEELFAALRTPWSGTATNVSD